MCGTMCGTMIHTQEHTKRQRTYSSPTVNRYLEAMTELVYARSALRWTVWSDLQLQNLPLRDRTAMMHQFPSIGQAWASNFLSACHKQPQGCCHFLALKNLAWKQQPGIFRGFYRFFWIGKVQSKHRNVHQESSRDTQWVAIKTMPLIGCHSNDYKFFLVWSGREFLVLVLSRLMRQTSSPNEWCYVSETHSSSLFGDTRLVQPLESTRTILQNTHSMGPILQITRTSS